MKLNEYQIEAAETAILAAKLLENSLNGQASTTAKYFCGYVFRKYHRYLCNEFFTRLIREYITMGAALPDRYFDPRNESAILQIRKIKELMNTSYHNGEHIMGIQDMSVDTIDEISSDIWHMDYREMPYSYKEIRDIQKENEELKRQIKKLMENAETQEA